MPLYKLVLITSGLILMLSLFGPYDYDFSSRAGYIYYYFTILCFVTPLVILSNQRGESIYFKISLTKTTRKFLKLASILSILASILFLMECYRLYGWAVFDSTQNLRAVFSEDRSNVSKYLEIISCLASAIFLIVAKSNNENHESTLYKYSKYALILQGLTGLFLGGRWKVFICFLLYIFCKEKRHKYSRNEKILFFIFGLTLLFLFAVRGNLSIVAQYRFYEGDMNLRSWAIFLHQFTFGMVDPFIKLSDYIAQSPFVFSHIFEHYIDEPYLFGLYALRPIVYILGIFDKSINYEALTSTVFTGMYSGSAVGIIADFGIAATPIVFVIIGLLFGIVERYRRFYPFFQIVYPILQIMCLLMPIYYLFHVGFLDWVILWFVLVYVFVLKIFGFEVLYEERFSN